jgi:cytoskeleton protein RodZ
MADEAAAEAAQRAPATPLAVGERLRSARKARALNLAQVAEALRLEEASVVALEEGRFAAMGAPVFVRGHLRRYAELVSLSPESVLEAYRLAAPDSDAPPALGRARRAGPATPVPGWLPWALAVAVVLAVVLSFVAGSRDEVPSPAAALVVPAPVPAAPVPAEPLAGTSRLVLDFNADAWVEIDDAERRVLYGLQVRGSQQTFTVRLPIRFMTKNAAGVTLTVDGQPVPIPPESVLRSEARFEWPPPAPPVPTVVDAAATPPEAAATAPLPAPPAPPTAAAPDTPVDRGN